LTLVYKPSFHFMETGGRRHWALVSHVLSTGWPRGLQNAWSAHLLALVDYLLPRISHISLLPWKP